MAIFSVIRFDGLRNRDWVIYKYPMEDIVLGSQLIVQEGQIAIFVRGGNIADIFYPGTYTLNTDNLPIIKTLVNLPFGGQTPFSAEIYYINVTVHLDMNWGTTDPIPLVDPKYYVRLRIRAFGQMALRILDGSRFFREVVGGMQRSDIIKFEKVKEYFRGILVLKTKSAIADAIITKQISALEVTAKLEELSSTVKDGITPEFEKYGFSVLNFFIQSINFPDGDFEKINKILEEKAKFEIMGDVRYATKRSFDVYEGAANNENGTAGAFASGGLGLAAGVSMGAAMGQMTNNSIQNTSGEYKTCVSCHMRIPIHTKFCPECGANNIDKICTCGHVLKPETKFCPECGKKVE